MKTNTVHKKFFQSLRLPHFALNNNSVTLVRYVHVLSPKQLFDYSNKHSYRASYVPSRETMETLSFLYLKRVI